MPAQDGSTTIRAVHCVNASTKTRSKKSSRNRTLVASRRTAWSRLRAGGPGCGRLPVTAGLAWSSHDQFRTHVALVAVHLQSLNGVDFAVADLSLASYGRHQIRLAEHEMPGLMAIRKEYAAAQPLRGARIAGSLHMPLAKSVASAQPPCPPRRVGAKPGGYPSWKGTR
jgi:hypothetical protein